MRVTEDDPLTPWIDQGDWGGDNHCTMTGKIKRLGVVFERSGATIAIPLSVMRSAALCLSGVSLPRLFPFVCLLFLFLLRVHNLCRALGGYASMACRQCPVGELMLVHYSDD